MTKKIIIVVSLLISFAAHASKPFTIADMQVRGLQRISAGTVFNYMPVKVGDRFDTQASSDIIRSLYRTGFFKDIRLSQEGNTLVIEVEEYPSIDNIQITGNKLIKEESLRDALASNNFIEGRVFNPATLDQVEQELKSQYLNQGKYNVQVQTKVEELDRNRVAVKIKVREGKTAKIKQINIIGNEFFSDKQLLRQMKSRAEDDVYFFSSRDQYSKEQVSGDLEALRSFYQDQGFLDFEIVSNQVSISPKKDGIYLTVNIKEGERFTVSQFSLNGRLVVPESELLPLVSIAPGSIYSRKLVEQSVEAISDRLADEGYAYAQITPIPSVNAQNNTVAFAINVNPGRRVYVRRIDIVGNKRTNDEVIRRELRQFEGSAYSPSRVNRSKVRLQRLSFFEDVEIENERVPGSVDQVDLTVIVEERATGSFLFGAGYSGDDGVLLQTSISENNLFGTGKQLNFGIERSEIVESASIQYTNPYHSNSGVSRTIGLVARSVDASEARANTSDYITDTFGVNVGYLFPLNEHNAVSFGVGAERIDLESTVFTVPEIEEFIDANPSSDLIKLTASYSHDTRDSLLYPTKGKFFRVSAETSIPGSDLEYYKLNVEGNVYIPITQRISFKLSTDLGYGDGFGDSEELPFFKNYFAGGTTTVRGFEARSLGPRDSSADPDPLGGSKRILFNSSLLLPVGKEKDKRLSLFVDGGQVFSDEQSIDTSDIRFSAGVGFNWVSPVGPISLSYAVPLNEEDGDEVEKLQFSVGRLLQ